jgi:hypothetical protein
MTPTTPDTRAPVPHRLASTLLGLLPGAALLVGSALLVRSWRDELPDPVAVHFGSGGADGFGSLTELVVVPVVIMGTLAVTAWLLAVLAGRSAATRRIAVGFATGMSAFGAALTAGLAWAQRGLADAAAAETPGSAILLAVALGLALGALAAWAMPGDAPAPAGDAPPLTGARVPLGTHERAVWTRRVVNRVGIGAGAGTVALVAVLALALALPALLLVAVAVAALVLTTAVFVVTVDLHGLSVRSATGWPRTRIPLDEVLGVEVTRIRPSVEFGGWGYRVGRDGRVGYVVRAGEGVQVARTGGRRFVVTVDDAATAAALLTTLVDRERVGRTA